MEDALSNNTAIIKLLDRIVSTASSGSGDTWLESRQVYWLHRLRFLVLFLINTRRAFGGFYLR